MVILSILLFKYEVFILDLSIDNKFQLTYNLAMKRTHNLTACAMMVAILAVLAQISIPMPSQVPLTLQTAGIILAGLVLGPQMGALSVLVYLLLGAVGAPVFAAGRGGLGVVAGPTGGFFVGFVLAVLLIGWLLKESRTLLRSYIAVALATLLILVCGVIYYSLWANISLWASFIAVGLPFLPGDVIKMLVFTPLGLAVRKALP